MMKNIGMTGGIACGKSAVASIFEELGFYTIDSDNISKIVMSKGEGAYYEIIDNFGKDIIDSRCEKV